jgi:hypothetical protein
MQGPIAGDPEHPSGNVLVHIFRIRRGILLQVLMHFVDDIRNILQKEQSEENIFVLRSPS